MSLTTTQRVQAHVKALSTSSVLQATLLAHSLDITLEESSLVSMLSELIRKIDAPVYMRELYYGHNFRAEGFTHTDNQVLLDVQTKLKTTHFKLLALNKLPLNAKAKRYMRRSQVQAHRVIAQAITLTMVEGVESCTHLKV